MKKFISLLSIILLFFTCVVSGQTTVSIDDVTVVESGEVMVPVSTSATLDEVGSLTLNIAYDTTKVEFLSVENNMFTGNFVSNAADGVVSIAWFATEAVEVTGKLFDLKFNYTEGTSLIQFTGINQLTDAANNQLAITFDDGSVGPEPAALGLGEVLGESGDTVKVPFNAVNLEGIGSMGFYIDYDTAAVEYIGLTDDVVGFTASPAETANGQVILTWFSTSGFDFTEGVLANLNFIVKTGMTNLTFVAPTEITDTENNVLALVPTDGKVTEDAPFASLVLGDVEGFVGEEVAVPMTAILASDLASFTLTVAYDTAKATFVEYQNLAAGSLVANDVDGLINLAWFNTSELGVDEAKLFDLVFTYDDTLDVALDLEAVQITDIDGAPLALTMVDGSIVEADFPIPDPVMLNTWWEKGADGYPFFAADNNARGMAYNPTTDHILVASRTGGNVIHILDAKTSQLLGQLDMTGVDDIGQIKTNQVSVAADGAIYVSSLVAWSFASTNYTIHKWENEDAAPTVAFEGLVEARTGDSFIASGSGTETVLYASGTGNTNVNVFTTTDGSAFELTSQIPVAAGAARGGISVAGDNIWINGYGGNAQLVAPDGTILYEFDGAVQSSALSAVSYLQTSDNEEWVAVGVGTDNRRVEVWNVTPGHPAYLAFYDSLTTPVNANGNGTGVVNLVEDADGNVMVYHLMTNNGIAVYSTIEAPVPVYTELPLFEGATDGALELEWADNALGGPVTMTVVDSTASAWGSHVVRYDDEAYTGLALANYTIEQSYTISADIYIVGEQSDTFPLYTGLTIKAAKDEFAYYRFVFRNSSSNNGQLRLQGYDGANWHISQYWNPDVDFEALETGWHNFKITLEDNKFYAFIDGKMLPGCPFVVEGDAAFLTKGFPGIYVYNGANGSVTFDNFTVEANQQLEYSIADIQTPAADTTDASQLDGMQVITGGVVTAVKLDDDSNVKEYYIQDGEGAWNGILVYSKDEVAVGDSVRLQGTVAEYYGKTELKYVNGLTVVNSGLELPAPVALSTADVNNEMYEGVLVSVTSAECVEENNNYGEAKFDDGSGVIMTDDAYSEAFPFVAETFYTIVGVVDYSFNNYKILYRSNVDGEDVTDVDDSDADNTLPTEFALDQNYPNPFNPTTKIQFALKVDSRVTLSIYNVLGEQVANLVNEDMSVGVKTVNFNAYNLSSGIYFYRIEAKGKDGSNFMDVKKMTLIK